MRVSLLNLTLLCLLVLLVVSTAGARKHHRGAETVAIEPKSIFGKKNKEKPKSFREKLQKTAMKYAVKEGLKKITNKGGK